jgi:hypothetical protein
VFNDLVVGEAEPIFEPVEKRRLEDTARAVEGVAGQPDHFALAKAQLTDVFHLLNESSGRYVLRQTHLGCPI